MSNFIGDFIGITSRSRFVQFARFLVRPCKTLELNFITHGASGVRNFWHLNAKILYTVEPKTATSPCVHFEVATSPTEKKTSLLHVPILSRFEIVEIIGPNTREITSLRTERAKRAECATFGI